MGCMSSSSSWDGQAMQSAEAAVRHADGVYTGSIESLLLGVEAFCRFCGEAARFCGGLSDSTRTGIPLTNS